MMRHEMKIRPLWIYTALEHHKPFSTANYILKHHLVSAIMNAG